MPLATDEIAALGRLERILDRVASGRVDRLAPTELDELVTLHRFATGALARVRQAADDPPLERRLNAAVARGHATIHARRTGGARRVLERLIVGFPEEVRRNARPIAMAALVFVGMALVGFAATWAEPELAYSLFDPHAIAQQERMLRGQEEFRGNFTFDRDEAGAVGVWIAVNNVRLALIAFVSGVLLLPVFLLLGYNGLMVGTIFGLAAAHGRLFDMTNLLMCHGTLELTAIVLAGGAGLRIGFAVVAPGPYSRRVAIAAAASEAGTIALGVTATLLVAAALEGLVTPYAPPMVRVAVALVSGFVLLAFLLGRQKASAPAAAR